MNEVSLLKLVADLIKSDKPTVEQVQCARTIINGLIDSKIGNTPTEPLPGDLDEEADRARRELM